MLPEWKPVIMAGDYYNLQLLMQMMRDPLDT